MIGKTDDRSNGDVAVDEYHRYKVQYYKSPAHIS